MPTPQQAPNSVVTGPKWSPSSPQRRAYQKGHKLCIRSYNTTDADRPLRVAENLKQFDRLIIRFHDHFILTGFNDWLLCNNLKYLQSWLIFVLGSRFGRSFSCALRAPSTTAPDVITTVLPFFFIQFWWRLVFWDQSSSLPRFANEYQRFML